MLIPLEHLKLKKSFDSLMADRERESQQNVIDIDNIMYVVPRKHFFEIL